MADQNSDIAEPTLLFSKEEWETAMPKLTADMTAYLQQYRTPVFIDRGDHGEPWGSGSFVEVGNSRFVLTNEHVARAKRTGERLGVRFDEQDQLFCITGDHIELPWPWDLALLPITDAAWSALPHRSSAIRIDQISMAHTPVPTEVFAFAGYAGERTTFVFGTMQFGATTSLAREVDLDPHAETDSRFHLGLAYLPDRATTVVGDRGLPRPPGLSGSTVWNTCFVEARAAGFEWSPELAKVTGWFGVGHPDRASSPRRRPSTYAVSFSAHYTPQHSQRRRHDLFRSPACTHIWGLAKELAMDGAGKLLGVVKELPLWMLAALFSVAVAASFYAPLQAGLPTPLHAQLPLLAVLLGAMTLCAALAHLISHLQTARRARAADERLRLEQIYAPIAALFVRRHVTACIGVLAPRLRHRLSNAWAELFRYRRAFVGVRRALRAIGDRQASTSAEIEYGGDFPMKEIHARVVANPALAGTVLLNLVRRADRSRYEDSPRSGLLTDEEYALFEHIHAEHQRLAKRLA